MSTHDRIALSKHIEESKVSKSAIQAGSAIQRLIFEKQKDKRIDLGFEGLDDPFESLYICQTAQGILDACACRAWAPSTPCNALLPP